MSGAWYADGVAMTAKSGRAASADSILEKTTPEICREYSSSLARRAARVGMSPQDQWTGLTEYADGQSTPSPPQELSYAPISSQVSNAGRLSLFIRGETLQ